MQISSTDQDLLKSLIWITSKQSLQHLWLQITDNGLPIDDENLQKLAEVILTDKEKAKFNRKIKSNNCHFNEISDKLFTNHNLDTQADDELSSICRSHLVFLSL